MERINVSGLYASSRSYLGAQLAQKHPNLMVLCRDRTQAEEIFNDLTFFQNERRVCLYPAWDTLPFEAVSPQTEVSATRLACLDLLLRKEPLTMVASVDALSQRTLPPKLLETSALELIAGMALRRADLIRQLRWMGYRPVSVVEQIGEAAIRGEVIDLFPALHDNPLRLEITSDTLIALRPFEADSQRTIGTLDRLRLLPVRETIPFDSPDFADGLPEAIQRLKTRAKDLECPPSELNKIISALKEGAHLPGIELAIYAALEDPCSVFDYLPPASAVIVDDEIATRHALEQFLSFVKEREERFTREHRLIPEAVKLYLSEHELFQHVAGKRRYFFNSFELIDSPTLHDKRLNFRSSSHIELTTRLKSKVGTGKALKPLSSHLAKWRSQGFRIAFVVGAKPRAERLQRALLEIEIDAPISELTGLGWASAGIRLPVTILTGHLSSGFTLEDEKLVFISETEIFPEKSYRRSGANKTSLKRILNSLSQLKAGDYIVHVDYGIGIYHGLKHLEIEGSQGDFLHVEYADSKLFLPVQNIGKVQKFFAGEGQSPQIDKLGSSRWTRTKVKVKRAVIALAGDLIKLYAARSVLSGWRFEPFGAEDERFADSFAFNETADQLRTIQEVLSDMAKDRPMDRLVCGDVGFGKTEVALRAAFKCVQHSRQVALLVPTTILVEQHRNTFAARFSDYPVKVGAVSRFYSAAENKKTLEQLANGDIDIIVGTHRLLQKDVAFKDLGLLIIDEEHRFGVQQKEKLKQMRKQVDVLSMTATPIPRTLHMSLLDVRDTSVINTPPHDRRAIRSYVATYTDSLVRDAILREVQRGGQVFYVHNRVQNIDLITAKLAEVVPEARFEFAHGQMSENQLESIMQRYLRREIDVLVCTTIIESGIDMPNTNTILIERADTFGLAQLYQLRGRVGRSSRQAYAYFLVPKFEKLGTEAQKRLEVLQSLDDLGLGFNLAVRDLEIRGAGNLLGKEQSGNVLSVGFELYTKILKEAVLSLKGDDELNMEAIDPELKINADAYIPEAYIPDVPERLLLYQRLAGLERPDDAAELYEEFEDRFGRLPPEVHNLIELMKLRSALRLYSIVKAEKSAEKLSLSLTKQSPLNHAKITAFARRFPERLRFTKSLNLVISLTEQESKVLSDLYAAVTSLLDQLKEDDPPNTSASNATAAQH
ncbi:MAG: transcription-repair coupling factor [Deltaproteobacteria bacterium]|nr:transcription-repair coupling factor [Deltaproteobacteria bacterium]